ALFIELLESPEHTLHVAEIESLVVVFEVNPTSLPSDIFFPLAGVLQHRFASLRVELRDTHVFDFALLGDTELLHRLELCRQAVRVPAEATLNLLAAHRLKTGKNVFRIPGEQVTVVGQPIGKGWPVVEYPLCCAITLLDRRAESIITFP